MKHAGVAIAAAAMLTFTGVLLIALSSCSSERAKECETLKAALRPLGDDQASASSAPSADGVARWRQTLDSVSLQDQPLREFAGKLRGVLDVLSSTLALKESPSAPDGTDDVIKSHLKKARTIRADVAHYCAE